MGVSEDGESTSRRGRESLVSYAEERGSDSNWSTDPDLLKFSGKRCILRFFS